jgi:hypothetical protein
VNQIKPDLTEIRRDGKTYVCVSGNVKDTVKYFEKYIARLLKKGYKPLKYDFKEVNDTIPPLKFEFKIEITPEIILALNKIAIEFYAYSGLDLGRIKFLSERVNVLDRNLDNVIFCNWNEEIRIIDTEEISHLIVLRKNKEGVLFCYIELFNVICAYIQLCDDYDESIDFIYHQDAISGERLSEGVILNLETEPLNKNDIEDFNILTNALFYRLREREFTTIYKNIIKENKELTIKDLENGIITDNEFAKTFAERCCKEIGQLTVQFPYMIEDFKDEENHQLNYIHSNLQEIQFERFCELNKHLIGLKVTFPDGAVYVFERFLKSPLLQRRGISIISVYCVLIQTDTNQRKYIPYREFFEGIIPH